MTISLKNNIAGKWLRAVGGVAFGIIVSCAVALSTIDSLAEERELPRYPFSDVIGAARLSELRFEYASTGGTLPARAIERSRSAALTAPLATDPFLFAALAYFPSSTSLGKAQAEPFLRELLRRDPRSRGAHILLLRRDLAERRIPSALFHLSRLKQLEPTLIGGWMQALGGQVKTTQAADEIAKALSSYPDLVDSIIEGVANGEASPRVIAQFASSLPRNVLVRGTAAPTLIDRLARDGYIAQARGLWAEWNLLPPREYQGLVYDPTFSQSRARPPFGWTYTENQSGVSEWKSPGSIYVEYYGRQSGTLLSQTLVLPPGKYRALVKAAAVSDEVDSMGVRVSCSGGTPVIADAPMVRDHTGNAGPTLDFSVSTTCPSQVFAIVGLPRERRVGGAMILHAVTVEHVDPAR